MTIYISLFVLAMIGALVYALANGKAGEIGRILFFCALFALLFRYSPK